MDYETIEIERSLYLELQLDSLTLAVLRTTAPLDLIDTAIDKAKAWLEGVEDESEAVR